MRLVTFNAEHARVALAGGGRGGTARPPAVEEMVEALVALAPDVVALQEVDRGDPATGGVDQPGAVAAALGGVCAFAPRRAGGTTGVALVVRGGLADVEVRRYVTRWGPPEGRPRLPLLRPSWRAVLLGRATVDGQDLAVTSAHLELTRRTSHAQLEAVVAALGARPGPHALLGDLNRRTAWVRATVAAGGLALVDDDVPTAPRHRPRYRIDHAAVGGLAVVASRVVALPVSDHQALVVDVEPTP